MVLLALSWWHCYFFYLLKRKTGDIVTNITPDVRFNQP